MDTVTHSWNCIRGGIVGFCPQISFFFLSSTLRPWPQSWLRHVMNPRIPPTTSSTVRTCELAETNTRLCDRSGRATPSRGSMSLKPYKEPSENVPFLNGHYISHSSTARSTHNHTRTCLTHCCRLNWSSISRAEASLQRARNSCYVCPAGCRALQTLWRNISAKNFPFWLYLVFHFPFVYLIV